MHFVFHGIICHFTVLTPFSCIGKVIQKEISDNATGILIVPNWPSQFWFTVLQDLLLTEAFIIPLNANNLYLPCLVSGKTLASSSIYLSGF